MRNQIRILALCILPILLCSCNTTQTLLSQVSSIPLPERVARKLALRNSYESQNRPNPYNGSYNGSYGNYGSYNTYGSKGTNPFLRIAPMTGPAGYYVPTVPGVAACYGVYALGYQIHLDPAYTNDRVARYNYTRALELNQEILSTRNGNRSPCNPPPRPYRQQSQSPGTGHPSPIGEIIAQHYSGVEYPTPENPYPYSRGSQTDQAIDSPFAALGY